MFVYTSIGAALEHIPRRSRPRLRPDRHSTLPPGKAYTTVELTVNYVKALTDRVPLVRAIGQTINVGGRIGTSEGRLVGPDGTLYAHATTTCLIFDPAPPK